MERSPSTLEHLLGILWPHRARWGSFSLGSLHSRFGQWLGKAQQTPCKPMPLLHSLSLPMAPLNAPDATRMFSLFRDTPSLTNLLLEGFPTIGTPIFATQNLDWSNLHTVTLTERCFHVHHALRSLLTVFTHTTLLRSDL
ncbi:hypothetical protein BDV98DRAFT_572786, partial [Pterulicium gracile]